MSCRITAWVCDECSYWRQDKSSGVHQTTDRAAPNGALVVHALREAEFVEVERGTTEAGNPPTPESAPGSPGGGTDG